MHFKAEVATWSCAVLASPTAAPVESVPFAPHGADLVAPSWHRTEQLLGTREPLAASPSRSPRRSPPAAPLSLCS